MKMTPPPLIKYPLLQVIMFYITFVSFHVFVVDPVTEAKVTCPSNATLHCEAEGDSLDYSWSGPGLKTAEMRGQTGPQISKENQDSVYTCVVNNTVSHSSVTYHVRDCFTSDAGDHQLILGVVCAVAVIGVIGAAGLGYYCYKINSRGQKHTGNENKRETDGKIITNQKKEESVLLLTGKHQASSCAVTQNTCDGSSDTEDRVTGDVQDDKMDTTQLDSAPRSDESAKPSPTVVTCPHADSSSGSPRQSRYTDAVRDANKCSGNKNMEGTCEYEKGTNTVTEEQNQTADPSLSGSAGSIRNDDIINTLPHGGQEEGIQVDDSSAHFKR
ncbi:uncharacterized protein LOC116221579 [Clupea harengus]|uniref:Uncharacterized protein LOC116221579 n=1 Tax=Clupea harengus TaxID=7950 RepID=A0A8M1KKQ9_CLUHA|nr:uncharacterized protein LOC116221579 [Clupea harengus]